MSRRILRAEEQGSLPLAMLATIVVAGMITVVMARVIAGENAVRFDRDFAESLQVADVGINRGLFALNEGREDSLPTTAAPSTETVDGITYEWSAEQTSSREWQVTSVATSNDVSRRVQATIEEVPLFFPGAFGDRLIALNGTSTDIDSYNSDPTCTTYTRDCLWGSTTSDRYAEEFGTGNGSIGTNEDFVFDGNTTIRPGGAFLYDWDDNPGQGITTDDPFGDRCDGNPCTTTYTSTIDDKLDFANSERMAFITDKFTSSGGCHNNSNPRQHQDWTLGSKNTVSAPLVSYATSRSTTPTNSDPTDPDFDNYYCAHSLEILGHLKLDPSVTPDNPVVIFVKDYVTVPNSGTLVACHDADASTWCDGSTEGNVGSGSSGPRVVTPAASRLQIYVAGIPHSGSTAGDISMKSQSMFAGVIYAPLSRCGGEGGGGADVYGAIICGTMDNVGNWDFHYDDALGSNGGGQFNVAFWQEVPPAP